MALYQAGQGEMLVEIMKCSKILQERRKSSPSEIDPLMPRTTGYQFWLSVKLCFFGSATSLK